MTVVPPGWLPDAGTEPEALIREARRRQRRRWLAAGMAIAVVIGGAAALLADSTGGHPRPSRPRALPTAPAHAIRPAPGLILAGAATTVVMWPVGYPLFTDTGGPPAYVDDLSSGRLRLRQIPGIIGCDCQPYLIGAGGRLVYVGSGGTMTISSDLEGKPRVLGSTQFFAPSAAPGRVWLVRFGGGYLEQGPVTVQSVPVAGGGPGPVTMLPSGAVNLVEGTDAGLLLVLRGPRFGLALWHPGAAPVPLPYSPSAEDGFDATARLVAYGTGCSGYRVCKVLRILNVVTGSLSSFVTPPGTAGWVPDGFNRVSAVSPADQMMAAYAALGAQRQGLARLYVMRLTGGRARAVPSSVALWFTRTAWSVKASWLLYQGARGLLWAYQVTSGKTRASSTPCCDYTVMVAAPNPVG